MKKKTLEETVKLILNDNLNEGIIDKDLVKNYKDYKELVDYITNYENSYKRNQEWFNNILKTFHEEKSLGKLPSEYEQDLKFFSKELKKINSLITKIDNVIGKFSGTSSY